VRWGARRPPARGRARRSGDRRRHPRGGVLQLGQSPHAVARRARGRRMTARERFARVPFADWLGVGIDDLTADRAVLVLPHRAEHLNARGVLQGGASASLLTMAGALAAWTGVD